MPSLLNETFLSLHLWCRPGPHNLHPEMTPSVHEIDEEIGGFLSAGRGFVHVGADGALEPCPFASFSDVNVRTTPLKEALQSDFLRRIRLNHERLEETGGGCALWMKREWVKSLLHS